MAIIYIDNINNQERPTPTQGILNTVAQLNPNTKTH